MAVQAFKRPRAVITVVCAAISFSLWGCAQPIEAECGPDGSTPMPHDDGGVSNTDGGGQQHQDAGTDDGGTQMQMDGGTDAGVVSRADAGPFSWALIPGAGQNEIIRAVHGSSATNVYSVSTEGYLRHSAGGPMTTAYLLPGTYPPELRGVYVTPSGKVFAGGASVALHCLSGACTQQADFTQTNFADLNPVGGTVDALCGRGDDAVYAVGEYGSRARMWTFDFAESKWKVMIADLGTPGGDDCFVAESGEVFVTATQGRIVRVTTLGLPVIEYAVASSGLDPSTQTFFAITGVNGRLFATGSSRRIVERDHQSKTWNFVFAPTSSTTVTHWAIGGGAPDELFAAGDPGSNKSLTRWDGESWTNVPDTDMGKLPIYMDVHDIWAPEPDIIFFAGEEYLDGALMVGTR